MHGLFAFALANGATYYALQNTAVLKVAKKTPKISGTSR
jgi:hypothetical protein